MTLSRRLAARSARLGAWLAGLLALAGCTTTAAVIGALGIATDTSATWSIAKYFHDKWVEGGPVPCYYLNSVERALAPHCLPYQPGLMKAEDLAATYKLPLCPLAMAARDSRLWPALPELIDKGAMPEACARSPLVELAQADPCPDFGAATPQVRESLLWLAQADARAIHHDVVRMLSCPRARAAGFDNVIERWVAQGQMQPGQIGFSPLSALHPDMLASPLAAQLEAAGHRASAALDPYDGKLRPGFEVAFRSGNYAALDWWLTRAPQLVNRVPPQQGDQLPWVPLAKTLGSDWLEPPVQRQAMAEYLLARGASPGTRLPAQPEMTVLRLARQLNSPLLPLLERPPPRARTAGRGGP
ncbi:MAG: hypothetical protein LKCHEGNO_00725 [Burkholderiaceae bacterium]|nr:hypothetical protein [Burkholderiaceae bacterium]